MNTDDSIALFSAIAAAVIVLGAWLVAVGFLAVFLNKRVAAVGHVPDETGAMQYVFYALSVLFWPAGLALAIYLMMKPATVRAGRVCAWMVIGVFTASVLAADAIVIALAVMMPEFFS
jgi:hypothetical protein